jgi:hypothetical protein
MMLGEDLLEGFPAWQLVLKFLIHVLGYSLIDGNFLNVLSLSWRISLHQLQMKGLERRTGALGTLSESAFLPFYLVLYLLNINCNWSFIYLSLGDRWLISMIGGKEASM